MDKTIYLDTELCVGCGACVVACMDQNDLDPEKGQPAFRRVYRMEEGEFPEATIRYIPAACKHCEERPCLIVCPTGAIAKNENTGAVVVDKRLCIGCHTCGLACPFGVPRYDKNGKLHKCNLCLERVEAALEPACVRVCPMSALKFDSPNKLQEAKESRVASNLLVAVRQAAVVK